MTVKSTPDASRLPLTEANIATLIDVFYDRVRVHRDLGPVFNAAVHDWPEHKALLSSFWNSVALKTQTYRGNPMRQHFNKGVRFEHFAQWLDLWRQTTDELLEPDAATELQHYAERIGHSLKYGLGLTGAHGGRDLGLPVVGQ
ncbi:group III truncated hemoglobin [Aquilutibacter rugosus]|uniref:group III truncated hemoglobin n=1 Tax=Aquilutibacter rugosus TaxID=3115820 RepID=UPI002F400257